MKMKLRLTTITASLFVFSIAAMGQGASPPKSPETKLPSAQEILARYVKAIGGREANEKIKARTTKGTLEMSPMGVKGTFETIAAAGDRSLTKMNIAGIGEILEGFDGRVAWAVNPIQGNREKSGAELAQAKLLNSFYREINLDKLYPKLEVKGVEKVDGKDAYVVSASPEGLDSETFYFDAESSLLLRSDTIAVSPQGNQPIRVFYGDYREVDGVKIPFQIRSVMPQFEMIMNITEVKHGGDVKPEMFAKPK